MINYFNILNLTDSENITDEMVEKQYNKMIKEALKQEDKLNTDLLNEKDEKKRQNIQKQLEIIEEQIQLLHDAYAAVKNEHARNNYRDLRRHIKEYMNIKKESERLKINESVLKSSRKLSELIKKANDSNNIDTTQLLKNILKETTREPKQDKEQGIGIDD